MAPVHKWKCKIRLRHKPNFQWWKNSFLSAYLYPPLFLGGCFLAKFYEFLFPLHQNFSFIIYSCLPAREAHKLKTYTNAFYWKGVWKLGNVPIYFCAAAFYVRGSFIVLPLICRVNTFQFLKSSLSLSKIASKYP